MSLTRPDAHVALMIGGLFAMCAFTGFDMMHGSAHFDALGFGSGIGAILGGGGVLGAGRRWGAMPMGGSAQIDNPDAGQP